LVDLFINVKIFYSCLRVKVTDLQRKMLRGTLYLVDSGMN